MDIFLEYIVPRRKGMKETVKILLIVFALLFLFTLCSLLVFTVLSGIALPIFAAGVYGAYIVITSQNVEFEYIVTNGELDVDSIIHRRKRKRLITVHSRTFDLVAPCGESEFAREENATFTKVIDASSGVDNGKRYFAVFSKDGMKIKLIFEPTEKMLDAFKTFVPRNVHKRADA